jgi:hypothetical protein
VTTSGFRLPVPPFYRTVSAPKLGFGHASTAENHVAAVMIIPMTVLSCGRSVQTVGGVVLVILVSWTIVSIVAHHNVAKLGGEILDTTAELFVMARSATECESFLRRNRGIRNVFPNHECIICSTEEELVQENSTRECVSTYKTLYLKSMREWNRHVGKVNWVFKCDSDLTLNFEVLGQLISIAGRNKKALIGHIWWPSKDYFFVSGPIYGTNRPFFVREMAGGEDVQWSASIPDDMVILDVNGLICGDLPHYGTRTDGSCVYVANHGTCEMTSFATCHRSLRHLQEKYMLRAGQLRKGGSGSHLAFDRS